VVLAAPATGSLFSDEHQDAVAALSTLLSQDATSLTCSPTEQRAAPSGAPMGRTAAILDQLSVADATMASRSTTPTTRGAHAA
jgi:hypothetical protein